MTMLHPDPLDPFFTVSWVGDSLFGVLFHPTPTGSPFSENALQDTTTTPCFSQLLASVGTTPWCDQLQSPLQDQAEITFCGTLPAIMPCSDSSSSLSCLSATPLPVSWNTSLRSTATESSSQVSGLKEHDPTHSHGILSRN